MSPHLETSALYGLLGALIFAGPRYSVCFRDAQMANGSSAGCLRDGLVALALGACGAFLFAPFFAELLKVTNEAGTRAISGAIGMVANPLAPRVNKALGDGVVAGLRKWLSAGEERT